MKKKESIVGTVLALCLVLALAFPVLAGGLTVIGAKIETSVGPGHDYSYTMKVKNTSDEPMDIGVEVKGYGMMPECDFIALEAEKDNSPYTARELLAVSPDNFHLEPGDSQVITVTAEIPSEIGDGGRYAAILIHTAPKGEMVAIIGAIAARVLLTIDGSNLIHNSEVTSVSLWDVTPGEPVEALVTVVNNGNHHYKPCIRGTLRSRDKIVATALIDADWPIIPGYVRQFELSFTPSEPITGEEYEVEIEVLDEASKLVAEYPPKAIEEQEPAEEEQEPAVVDGTPETVTPAPGAGVNWPLIGGVIAGVIVIALLIFLVIRRRAY